MTPLRSPSFAGQDPHGSSRGFTLIELVVATGIFALLIGTVTGVFVSLTRGQRSGLAQTTILGDAETFLELLEREVRTGYGNTFRCVPGSAPESAPLTCAADTFVFANQDREEITYRLTGTQITRVSPATGTTTLTSPAVAVRFLEYVAVRAVRNDHDPGDPTDDFLGGFADGDPGNRQGRVTVRIRACPRGVTDDARCIFVQTTLTSRQYAPF